MNKLIIVGNGFDKAHGLPTSYTEFIDDFWSKLREKYLTEEYKKLVFVNEQYSGVFDFGAIRSYDDFINILIDYSGNYNYDFESLIPRCTVRETGRIIFEFKNLFFRELNKKLELQNWVDVENEYYNELKRIAKLNRVCRLPLFRTPLN